MLFERQSDDKNVNADEDVPILLRRDSEFTVGSDYHDGSPNNMNVWQGSLLLVADCMGTGILALPADIHVLGYGLGLGFLLANLPINLYAGTILSLSASEVEQVQTVENRLWNTYQRGGALVDEGNDDNNYQAINSNTINSTITIETSATAHTQLHHDTATYDFIGMTRALFRKSKAAPRIVLAIYYVNIFLVLGNYILVMSK